MSLDCSRIQEINTFSWHGSISETSMLNVIRLETKRKKKIGPQKKIDFLHLKKKHSKFRHQRISSSKFVNN